MSGVKEKEILGASGEVHTVIDGDGFFISYNPNTSNTFGLTFVSALFAGDGDTPAETAIVKDGDFYILNGDFRERYRPLVPQGFDACLKFYKANMAEHGSSWSDKLEEIL